MSRPDVMTFHKWRFTVTHPRVARMPAFITRVPDRNSRSAKARRDTVDALDERLDTPAAKPKFLSIGEDDLDFQAPPQQTPPKPIRKLHERMQYRH